MKRGMTDLEKTRGKRLLVWREDVEMLRMTISDEDRRVIVDALFDWFLGSDVTLPGVVGLVLGKLIERQKKTAGLSAARSDAGKKGMAERWGGDNKPITKDSVVITNDNKNITNGLAPARDMRTTQVIYNNQDNINIKQDWGKGVIGGKPSTPQPSPDFPLTADAMVNQKRTPPTLDNVLAIARNLGIDADWARNFHEDMAADGWCYINASGNTAIVNVLNVCAVMRKRYKWAKEDVRQSQTETEASEASARAILARRNAKRREAGQ